MSTDRSSGSIMIIFLYLKKKKERKDRDCVKTHKIRTRCCISYKDQIVVKSS